MGHALQSSLLPASLTSRTQSSSFMTNRMKETSTFFDIWAGGAGSQGHSDDDAPAAAAASTHVCRSTTTE